MINTLIGQKTDQKQDFLQNGVRIPVTEIFVTDNFVTQVKTAEKDEYLAIQLGAGVKKRPIKAVLGHVKKAGVKNAPLKIKEVRIESTSDDLPKAGDSLAVDVVFKPGDIVEVTGTSKGKGFAGGVRRYNFRGGPKTHGQSDRHRAPGSIGQTTTPGRVYKGKRMAGRMGSDTVTVKNLTVVDVDAQNKKLYVSGLIPGHKNSWVLVTRTGEDKKFVPLLSNQPVQDVVADVVEEEVIEEVTPVVEAKDEVKETTTEVKETEEVVTSDTVATDTVVAEKPEEAKPEEIAEEAVEVPAEKKEEVK